MSDSRTKLSESLYSFPKQGDKPYLRRFEIYLKDLHLRTIKMIAHETDIQPDENKVRSELHDCLDDVLDALWNKKPLMSQQME